MSYGADTLDAYREVGIYAGRKLSACCCAAVCCESDGWLQAEMRAAPAMAPTNAHFANATRLADLGFRGGSPFMAVLLWLQRATRPACSVTVKYV